MKKLKKILGLSKEERTEDDIKFLADNADKLTEEQKKQLADEEKGSEIIEEVEAKFVDPILKESLGQKIFRNFSSKVKDLGNGLMEAIISSETLDRHGEKIDMKGMSVKEYMQNPIMAPFHQYDKPSVGRTHKLTKTADGKLIAKFEWAKDQNPEAKILHDLYRDGFQFAFSIGFIPYEADGNTYTKSTMLEFSPVLVPANPDALLLAKSKGVDKNFIISYTETNMLILKDVVEKEVENLTVAEVKFLKENIKELTQTQKEKFAEVLEEKDLLGEVGKMIDSKLSPIQDQLKELKVEEKTITKDIRTTPGITKENATKEDKFKAYVKGLVSKNFSDYIELVGKDAMTTTNTSEVLPPTEFINEVQRLEEQYGVAEKYAEVRNTDRTSITMILGDDTLELDDTAEAGKKKSKKLNYDPFLLTFRKYTGIVPLTEELLEDSAVDLFNDCAKRFARAGAKKADEIIFTRAVGAGNLYGGILHVSGTHQVVIPGDSIEDLDYDTISKMIWAVPTSSSENGKFWLNHEILGVIQRIKDLDGRPIWQRAMADGTPATILGKSYVFTEVMPGLADDDADTPFFAFGDLQYATLGIRSGLKLKIFDTGNVGDPSDEDQDDLSDLNLLTDDMQAMRAVKRMNGKIKFPAAFSVAVTGSAGS